MSSFEDLKVDIAATLEALGKAAVQTAGGTDGAHLARQRFDRIAPHASRHPEVGQLAVGIGELEQLTRQAHHKAMELYYLCERVDALFT